MQTRVKKRRIDRERPIDLVGERQDFGGTCLGDDQLIQCGPL